MSVPATRATWLSCIMSGKTVATLSANVFVIILRLLANTEIGRQVFHKSVVLASFRNKCNIFRFVWLCNNSCSICFFIPWPIDHMGLLTLTLSNTKSYLSAIPSNSFDLTNWKDIQSYFKKKKIIIVIEWYNPKSFKKVDPFWFNGWEHLVHWLWDETHVLKEVGGIPAPYNGLTFYHIYLGNWLDKGKGIITFVPCLEVVNRSKS